MPLKTYKRPDKRKQVKKFIDKGLDWEAMELERDPTKRQDYSQASLLILESKVWQNETKRIVDKAIRTAAAQAGTMDEVKDMRMLVAAIDLLNSRFREIANWHLHKTSEPEDPFSAV